MSLGLPKVGQAGCGPAFRLRVCDHLVHQRLPGMCCSSPGGTHLSLRGTCDKARCFLVRRINGQSWTLHRAATVHGECRSSAASSLAMPCCWWSRVCSGYCQCSGWHYCSLRRLPWWAPAASWRRNGCGCR